MAADDLGEPLSRLESEAIDYFQSIAFREDMCFYVHLEPGEAFLINNFTVLHSRTEFEDYDEPDRRRHLLRLWLKVDGARPLAEGVRRYYGADGIEQEHTAERATNLRQHRDTILGYGRLAPRLLTTPVITKTVEQ